jgi:hypothetical protein
MSKEDSQDEMRERRGWHFSKTFTLGELVSACALGLVIWQGGSAVLNEMRVSNAAIDKRVSILEVKAEAQKQVDEAQDRQIREGQGRIEAQLADIQRYLRDRAMPALPSSR